MRATTPARFSRRVILHASVLAIAVSGVSVASVRAATFDPNAVPSRTQISLRHNNGAHIATANAYEARPALSLAKLYLGQWVLKYGALGDKAVVEDMIRYSDDAIASRLDGKYPQAIDTIAGEYRLSATRRNGFWGNSVTSSADVTQFLNAIRYDPIAAPIIRGMDTAAPRARDGYRQDYGTFTIPGVWATKFAWSDDGQINATASFGPDYSIAASTYGPPDQLTRDVQVVQPGMPLPADATAGIPLGSLTIPAVHVRDVLPQLACIDPLNAHRTIPGDMLIPLDIARALPRCPGN